MDKPYLTNMVYMMRKVNDEMLKELKRMFYEGITYKEIAKKLGISYKTVVFYLRKMGLSRKTTREKKEQIKKLYESGYPIDEISKIVGLSKSKIHYHLKRMNVEKRHDYKGKFRLTIKIPRDEWKLAYIAGIIDGEGTISVFRSRFSALGVQPFISVKNTNKELMDFLYKEIGGHVRKDKKDKPHYKDRWYWRINGFCDVYCLLKALQPYLIIKKKQAEKVMEICEKRLGRDVPCKRYEEKS